MYSIKSRVPDNPKKRSNTAGEALELPVSKKSNVGSLSTTGSNMHSHPSQDTLSIIDQLEAHILRLQHQCDKGEENTTRLEKELQHLVVRLGIESSNTEEPAGQHSNADVEERDQTEAGSEIVNKMDGPNSRSRNARRTKALHQSDEEGQDEGPRTRTKSGTLPPVSYRYHSPDLGEDENSDGTDGTDDADDFPVASMPWSEERAFTSNQHRAQDGNEDSDSTDSDVPLKKVRRRDHNPNCASPTPHSPGMGGSRKPARPVSPVDQPLRRIPNSTSASVSGESNPSDHQETKLFQELLPLPTQEIVTLFQGLRMPATVEDLQPLVRETLHISAQPNEEFELSFLETVLGGHAVSSGHYKIDSSSRQDQLIPNLKSYRALDATYEPLLPRAPGLHGAQISCIIEISNDSGSFPLFIRNSTSGYKYVGTYREPRAPDIIGGSEMLRIPHRIRIHWAKKLGRHSRHGTPRPPNQIATILRSWPLTSTGYSNEQSMTTQDESGSQDGHLFRQVSLKKVNEIGASDILKAFEKPDYDYDTSSPTMRFFYEYIQCVGYDKEFYEKLVAEKRKVKE